MCFRGKGTHNTRNMSFPGGATCFRGWVTHTPPLGIRVYKIEERISPGIWVSRIGDHKSQGDVRFSGWQTNQGDMCLPNTRAHITRDTSQVGEHISLGICLSQVRKHISLGICVFQVGEHKSQEIRVSKAGIHISRGIPVYQIANHISLGIRLFQVGENISKGICVSQVG